MTDHLLSEEEGYMERIGNIVDKEPLAGKPTDFYPVTLKSTARKDDGSALNGERHLIQRLQAGDRQAFDVIFSRYVNQVYRQAVKLTGNKADAEEVVQDVFLTVYQKAKTFRGKSAFSTWLYRVTLNTAISRLRRQKKGENVDIEEYLPRFREDGHHLVRPVADWSGEIEQRLMDKELQKTVHEAIDQLPPVDKAILLSDLDGFSNREIGDTVGLSVQAVKARLHRARLFLRGKLAVHFGYSST